jgi:hypothetical protein
MVQLKGLASLSRTQRGASYPIRSVLAKPLPSLEGSISFLMPLQLFEDNPLTRVGICIIGVKLDSLLISHERFFISLESAQSITPVVIGRFKLGIKA